MVGGSNGLTNRCATIGRERVASLDDVKATTLKEKKKKKEKKENTSLLFMEMINTSKNSIRIVAQTTSVCPS